jgi:iron complex outermembrane receptor protein
MKTFISFLLIFISIVSYGQSFKGIILDFDTKLPVPNVEVYFIDFKTSAITDETGNFEFSVNKTNKIRLILSLIGYDSMDEVIDFELMNEKIFYLIKSHTNLEEVIVSGFLGKLQGDNTIIVEHKKMSELQQTLPLTLMEAVSEIPGVNQTTTGGGIGKPVIRGLSGNRIVTYAQGIRIENQQWGDEHGLGVGEVGIESVEVIKGPASLLYGSDAIGGVLYFIDERYASQNSIEGFLETKFLSNTLGSINNAGLKVNKGKLKLNVFGSFSTQADYQIPNFNRVFNTRFNESNIKISLGFNTKNWISNIRYSFLQNNFGIIEDAAYSKSTDKGLVLPLQSINNQNFSFENTLFTGKSKLNLTLGYTSNYRKEFEDEVDHHALGLKLNTLSYNLKWDSPVLYKKLDFVIGSQGMYQTNLNNGEEVLIPDATTIDVGTFMLANLNFNKLKLQGGVRVDFRGVNTKEMHIEHHHESEDEEEEMIIPAFNSDFRGATFSGGAVYRIKNVKLRANVSSGFRAPNSTELLSNGVHHGTNRYIKGDDNLINENAIQIDFSFNYQSEHFEFSANPFYNAIQNYIFLSPTVLIIEESTVFQYVQTNSFLYGGEIGLHYHPHKIHWLHLESSMSTVMAEDREGNTLPLVPQTKLSSTIKSEFSNTNIFQIKSMFVQHIYKFNQNRIGAFETSSVDYSLINIGLNLEIKTKKIPITVTTSIKNVLNVSYVDHLSQLKVLEIPNQGISFNLGLKLKFN